MKYIPLTKNCYAMVDNQDYSLVKKYRWCVCGAQGRVRYALTSIRGKHIQMHRLILNPPDDMVVDHINGNGLDNRRRNMVVTTGGMNKLRGRGFLPRNNTTGVRGVVRIRVGKYRYWRARIKQNGRYKSLGHFKTLAAAESARQAAEREIFGKSLVEMFGKQKRHRRGVETASKKILHRSHSEGMLSEKSPSLGVPKCLRKKRTSRNRLAASRSSSV